MERRSKSPALCVGIPKGEGGSSAQVMEFARYFKNKGQESARAAAGVSKETLKNLNWLYDRPGTRGSVPDQPGERPVTRSIARRPCSRQSSEPHRGPDGEQVLAGSARERSVEAAAEAGRRGIEI